ncbi:MAG TPA: LacI family DNA-binding transcriptional regulator [Anaerolineae bacterium]|nr:LacI family DNA-binding transcriptional regulator [Anaerolineae bacterium]
MPITLEHLAQVAGVSVSTVSRALNDSDHAVNEDTRKRILTLAQQMGYRPNLMARSLKTDRTFSIGIIVDNIVSPFTPIMIRGIQDYLKTFGYFSLVINADWNPETETEAIHDLISRSIDGIIFVESWLREPNPTLDVANKPYVFVHRLFGTAERNAVSVDDFYGGRVATEHLIQLKHRRIAYISGPSGWGASENRLWGYRAALNHAEIPIQPEYMYEGDWEVQGGYAAVKNFLTLPEPPTAIFAANDLMALGAIYALQESGRRVPEDVAVVGYDDREIASIARPSITTVSLPCYEMGTMSAKLLLRLLRNKTLAAREKETQSEKPIKIKGKLIMRESSGAPEGKIPLERYQTHTTPRRLARLKKSAP